MEIFKKLAKYGWMLDILKDMSKEDRNNFLHGYKNRKTYYTKTDMDVNLKDMLKCANCPNMCRFDCPALQITKQETYSPAKKAQIAYFSGMDHISMNNSSIQNTFYACMTCDACREWCPMDISTGDLLVEMRQQLESRELIPPRMAPINKTSKLNGSIFEESPFLRDSEFNINDSNPEVFFYIGCMDLKYRKETVRATIKLLRHLNIPFCTHLEERQCCGGPVYKAGYRTTSQTIMEKNHDLLKKSKVKTVITNCPGCFSTLNRTYDKMDLHLKVDIKHSIEFFLQKIRNGDLKLTRALNKTIVFHDPCLISRSSSVQSFVKEFRELFKLIPGIKISEPSLHGKETRCCGMGGTYAVSNPDNAKKLHSDRLKQLHEKKADWIVSACPTCEYALIDAQKSVSESTESIFDFVELILAAIEP